MIKPKSAEVDERIVAGMLNIDPQAAAVLSLEECDIAILQKGWTRSKSAVQEYHKAKELHIPCREGYRTRSTNELLFCMLRSKHSDTNRT